MKPIVSSLVALLFCISGFAEGITFPAIPETIRYMQTGSGVLINGRELTGEQVAELKQLYGVAPPPGRYWYDPRSGLYGYWGFEAAGYIRPGHRFDPVPANASRGNTGVF